MCKYPANKKEEVANVVLENAPYNAKYTLGLIQKEILSIIANNVRKNIQREVGDSYFCVMVDEARDESKEEQMAIVLRGGGHGDFFTMKNSLIHDKFISRLTNVIILTRIMELQGLCGSSLDFNKRHDELQKAKSIEIEHLLELGEIKRIILFCEKHEIDMPDMEALYKSTRYRPRRQDNHKRETYYLFDRLIRLILTLSVSTATSERAFSAMKVCKNRLRNKMSYDFLTDNLMVYIEKEIAENIDSEAVIENFKSLKSRRAEL
nr:zinc finger MYM-type protein 1-like [Tanacetum cinerariifolium]